MRALIVILGAVGIVLAVMVIAAEDSPPTEDMQAKIARMIKNPDPKIAQQFRRDAAITNVLIKTFEWSSRSIGVMTATFVFENKNDFAVKDIEVRCEHTAPSGTKIDTNVRMIYQVFPAKSTRTVRDFNMGFVHSQSQKSSCAVTRVAID